MCAALPRIEVATRVVIVMHHVEARRPSNTGRLAARILGATVRLRGVREEGRQALGTPAERGRITQNPLWEEGLGATGHDEVGRSEPGIGAATGRDLMARRAESRGPVRRLLLFPQPTARVLSRADAADGPVELVVPDGNWRQASRVLHRDPAAAGAEIVALPPGPPSRYRLRRTPNPGALSTFEAIARALAILEYSEIEKHMMRALDLFVERTLVLRGGVPTAELTE